MTGLAHLLASGRKLARAATLAIGGFVACHSVDVSAAPSVAPGYAIRAIASGAAFGNGPLTGLVTDPVSGDIYVAAAPSPGYQSHFRLYRVAPSGATTFVGVYPFGHYEITRMAFGPDGKIYTLDGNTNTVRTIDPVTGASSVFFGGGLCGTCRHGLNFNAAGQLIIAFEPVFAFWRVTPTGLVLDGQVTAFVPNSNHGDAFSILPNGDYFIPSDCGGRNNYAVSTAGHAPGAPYTSLAWTSPTDLFTLMPGACGNSTSAVHPVTGEAYSTIANFGRGNSRILATPANGGPTTVLVSGAGAGDGQQRGVADIATGRMTSGACRENTHSLFFVDNVTTTLYEVYKPVVCNEPPNAGSVAASTSDGVAKSITISATDADNASLAFAPGAGPLHGTLGAIGAPACATVSGLTTCTATVVYTPTAGYIGPDSFAFVASDSEASSTGTVSITVNPKATPTVSLAAPASAVFGTSFTPVAASNAPLSATLAVDPGSSGVCSLSGGSVTMTSGTGTCLLKASWPANDDYYAASATSSTAAAKAAQSIAFGPFAAKAYGDPSFPVSARATSALPVSISSISPSHCTISSGGVTLGNAGTCTLRAEQGGSANFEAAASVERSFAVQPRSVTVSANAASKFLNAADPPLTHGVTAGSVVPGDSFTGALQRAAGEFAGTYPIGQGSLSLGANYSLNFVAADFHILELAVAGPAAPIAKGSPASVTGTFRDSGTQSGPACAIDWDNGTTTNVAAASVSGVWTCGASHTYAAAGVYEVRVTVSDAVTGTTSVTHQYIVIYDPSGGFVTGGGWILSPAGAYVPDRLLAGKATFGFVSKYQKGQSIPSGQTEFQFHAAGMTFKSTSYQWLVIAGARAQFKGVGTIGGAGNYGFLLTATDGQAAGGGGVDKFRIKIWDVGSETLVYDNMPGSDSLEGSGQAALGGGSVTIHGK